MGRNIMDIFENIENSHRELSGRHRISKKINTNGTNDTNC